MVRRKSEEHDGLVPAPLSKANPPYPTTPSEESLPPLPSTAGDVYSPNSNHSPAFNIKTAQDTRLPDDKHDFDSDFSEDEWDQSDDDFEDVDPRPVPDALKPAGGKAPLTASNSKNDSLPEALRAGPPAGVPIKTPSDNNISPMPTGASAASYGAVSTVSEQSNGSVPLQTNNPYLRMQTTGQSSWDGESSQAIWGDAPSQAQKYDNPVELPAIHTPTTPTHEMHKVNLESHTPPTQNSISQNEPSPLIAVNSPTPQSANAQDSMNVNPWGPAANEGPAGSGPWVASDHSTVSQQAAPQVEQEQRNEEGHQAVQQTTVPHLPNHHTHEHAPPFSEENPPTLPLRQSHQGHAPSLPPRPIDTGLASTSAPALESPNTRMNRQRKEHYSIKQIRWHDHNINDTRMSPILTQNLNGPCPLLALVNALVLSTPANLDTALIETLRTRETVSLGLLLDAVFDELMSGRRGDAAQALPDVSELYKFLLALHTGLNVNPMFVPDSNNATGQAALTNRAGAFENTQDMKLYRTFDIPLMHGWLAEAGTDAYAAFNRVAPSYETSQFVQFQEEELNAKLQAGESLDDDEQQMFSDIHAIKEFLTRWPTQLTDHGLKVIRDNLQPGQVAILFRNDHFSTLCRNPRNDQLVTLVTDQGYSTHDEIVWESLIDVNGQGSQLYSGDFRSVDNSNATGLQEQQQSQNLLDVDDNQGWTTVQGRHGNQQQSGIATSTPQVTEPTSPCELSRAEQEDHDLALALQLQEEEEDRERRANEQRVRDNELSRNTIASQNQPPRPNDRRASRTEQAPAMPPRRNNITTHRPTNEPAPPPTYEEASTAPRYIPPAGHPANPAAPIPPQGSAYQSTTGGLPPPPASSVGGRRYSGRSRRQSAGQGGMVAPNGEDRDKCVVM
ncbi:hypothetical protein BDW02DRAFT_276992 [Decorospora gaudefroyi]|uniref:MINDY deubiquitinase domain-containing protein n=1 Tax=Decorospora gaudefroyi TaxID=184978 RepID=A0A6A5KUN1_9PLEO|nr:hypothetical protein BDW02DRAFT_276992 [Decorospora gaudefroyi]